MLCVSRDLAMTERLIRNTAGQRARGPSQYIVYTIGSEISLALRAGGDHTEPATAAVSDSLTDCTESQGLVS